MRKVYREYGLISPSLVPAYQRRNVFIISSHYLHFHIIHQTGLQSWQQPGPELEAEQGPPRAGFAARLDRDGDGKVSRDEFDGPHAHFDHLDSNGDGYLSEEERPAVPPRRR